LLREKILTNIYRIDTSIFDETDGLESIISHIVSTHNEKLRKKYRAPGIDVGEFTKQISNSSFRSEIFNVITYGSVTENVPGWKEFISAVVDGRATIQNNNNIYVSYVTFFYNSENIYAICGGLGSHIIQEYIDENFGIEIVSRLISPHSKVVKSFQEKALTGSIMAATKFFRRDSKLAAEDEFGKIYREICAELNKDTLVEKLGFDVEDVTRDAGCSSKASFQLKRSINFNSLLALVGKIEVLLHEEPQITLNKVKLISKRVKKNKELIKYLENALYGKLFRSITDNSNVADFELCHPDYEKYLSADEYNVYKGGSKYTVNDEPLDELNDINRLLGLLVREDKVSSSSEAIFKEDIKNIRIESSNRDIPLNNTSGALMKHLHGEVEHNGKIYFHMDGMWYEIQSDFIENLNSELTAVIDNSMDESILPKVWNHIRETENKYSQKYLSEPQYFVLDKFLAENIEVCDILRIEDNDCVFIHIKKGFNNKMRDLTSQIGTSARRIYEDTRATTRYEYLRKYYRTIVKGRQSPDEYRRSVASQFEGIGEDDFIGMIAEKNISFCLAFQDSSDIRLGPRQYKSNIAKFSVLESQKTMASYSFGFRIAQIEGSP